MVLPKKADSLESDVWSGGMLYSRDKVVGLLIQLDLHENLALYGHKEIDEDFILPQKMLAYRRYIGLQKFASTLRQLLGNTKFAIRKTDQTKYKKFYETIDNVRKVMSACVYHTENMVTHKKELRINEKHFDTCMTYLQSVKDEMNLMLNNAGLIFRVSEGVDLDSMITKLSQEG